MRDPQAADPNWFPVPCDRATPLYMITLACGHSGVCSDLGVTGWFTCPHCAPPGGALAIRVTPLPLTRDWP